MQICDLRKD